MMNEKNLRELEYEKEMQEQADYIERWKLRKEIKKKLRALRKKVRKDVYDLPHLQVIYRSLVALENQEAIHAVAKIMEIEKTFSSRENPAKNVDSPTLPTRKCPG